MKINCQHCEFLNNTFGNKMESNYDYWVFTEVFFYLHKNDVCRIPNINEMPTCKDLLEYRKNRNLSLRDVAKETGVSAATISRIERGGEAEHSKWVKLLNFYNPLTK